MKVRTKAAMTVAAAGVLGSIMMAGPAYAASDGQQITFCGGAYGGHVAYSGNNQNGTVVSGSGYFDGNGGPCYSTTFGYWWIGDVAINWYSPSGSFQQTTFCYVPKNVSGSNVIDCWL